MKINYNVVKVQYYYKKHIFHSRQSNQLLKFFKIFLSQGLELAIQIFKINIIFNIKQHYILNISIE